MLKEIKELDTLILSVLDNVALTIIHNDLELPLPTATGLLTLKSVCSEVWSIMCPAADHCRHQVAAVAMLQ